ncbi:MAG: GFA family protein [Silicimonas sp.]|nr:GFA family protein [Silicimonas sp.]
MSDDQTGGCLCGACRYRVSGRVEFTIRCYCRDCQKVSGGGHLPQLAVRAADFSPSGPVAIHRATSDAGSDLEFAFCGSCGSPLFKVTSKRPDLVFVMAGSLDDARDFEVQHEVYEAARQPWDK